jgi:hypothetical protein
VARRIRRVTGVQGLGGEPEFADRSVVISHIFTGYRVRRAGEFSGKAMEAMGPVHRRVRILPGEPALHFWLALTFTRLF